MKLFKSIATAVVAGFLMFGTAACSKVPAGEVGVKVYLLGTDKGVDHEVLGPGRYWIGWNQDLYLFPVFTQNYTWTAAPEDDSPTDESIDFGTIEGMNVNADIGISYHIKPEKVSDVFVKYRKGINEITHVYLRNMVRDSLVRVVSTKSIDYTYGAGKAEIMNEVQAEVARQVDEIGIVIEKVYWIGELRLPIAVKEALNAKQASTQLAQQRENEVATARAEAQKSIAAADGEAQSITLVAKAQADANRILASSITPELVQYKAIEKWSGALPQVSGGAVPFINFTPSK